MPDYLVNLLIEFAIFGGLGAAYYFWQRKRIIDRHRQENEKND